MFATYDHLLLAAVAHWHAKTGPNMDPCSGLFNLDILTCWAYRHTFCEAHPLANYIATEPVTLNVVFRTQGLTPKSVSESFNRTISTRAFDTNTLKYTSPIFWEEV